MDAWSCLEKIQRSEDVMSTLSCIMVTIVTSYSKALFPSAVKISLLMLERVKAENVSKQNIEQVFNPFFVLSSEATQAGGGTLI